MTMPDVRIPKTDESVRKVLDLVRSLGTDIDQAPEGAFAVDFNNAILADPYLEGTGYLPDRTTAEAVAAIILPLLDALAVDGLAENPSIGSGWVNPEAETRSWATIVSAARTSSDEPVVEENYDGDVWFVASAELGLLDPEQRERLEKLNAALRAADQINCVNCGAAAKRSDTSCPECGYDPKKVEIA